tara:strand:- start:1221 stop:2870 length:1650 start_codon:yes stop_codon:yes gene_type:complete
MADYGIAPSTSKSNEGFSFAPIAPPTSSLWQDYQAAGNSADLKALMPRAAGTSLEPQIQRSAEIMDSGSKPVQNIVETSNAKGGLQTAEGRVALADSLKTTLSQQEKEALNAKNIATFTAAQPQVGIVKGVIAAMQGARNWQDIATQGAIRPAKEFDKNGKGAVVKYAANSSVPTEAMDIETGMMMSMAEYDARGFGKYSDITKTFTFKEQEIKTKDNTENLVKDAAASNVGAAIFPIIADNSQKIYDGFSGLRKFGLTDNEINKLQKMSTMTESVSSAVSSASQEFLQANDMTSLRNAIETVNKVGADAGLPKIVSINGINSFTDSNGNNYSKQTLLQRMTDVNSRSGKESQYTKNRELIIKDAVYQKLEGLGAKAEFDGILNLMKSNELLKADYRKNHGESPVFASSIPYELGQPMKVGMANAIIDQANAKIAVAYQAFFDQQSKLGPAPSKGAIAAAFIRQGIPQGIAAEYKEKLNAIQSSPDVETETKVVEPVEKPSKVGARSILTPAQKGRLAETPTAGKAIEKSAADAIQKDLQQMLKKHGAK